MQGALVGGIKYERLGQDVYYDQKRFESEELFGYLKDNMLPMGEKCVYDHVVYDSDGENRFAQDLNKNEDVKVFAKLPKWFKIDTPLGGTYNPDWAILVHGNDTNGERLFFVVETKGEESFLDGSKRGTENDKIKCGKAHFSALNTKAEFVSDVSSYETFKAKAGIG
jgi:type III restriction enzyme